jgi:hypothetical protein
MMNNGVAHESREAKRTYWAFLHRPMHYSALEELSGSSWVYVIIGGVSEPPSLG